MTHKEVITEICTELGKDDKTRFIGYNTVYGSRMYGTLKDVDKGRCVETPVCENLMMGLAMGMSLEGFRPVVCFERHDFLLIGLDAIVNHLDKMPMVSGYQYKMPVIVRAIVGSKEPLDPGPQHTADYTSALITMLKDTPVYVPRTEEGLRCAWKKAREGDSLSGASVIVEYRDNYTLQL